MSRRRLVLLSTALSLLYLSIQIVYIEHLPLVMDEFDGANEAYQLLHLIPYRDYPPYKTVLGYYAELPPLLVTSDVWTALMLSKIWLAAINTSAILAATLALASIFSPVAALLGQVLLVFVSTFLERSSEIRVDMLTAWVGLASLLMLLRRQWFASGVLAAVSFLVSQKGVYYIVAADAAVGIYWLCESRDRRTFINALRFNAGMAATIALYIAGFAIVAGASNVMRVTFMQHGAIALQPLYDLREHWVRTLTRNPLYYFGAGAGIIGLIGAWRRGRAGGTHLIAATYGAVVFALCAWHKQPWPYFFVILIPTLMVVHVAALDLIWRDARWRTAVLGLIAAAGIAWPLQFMPGILERDHVYQRQVIRLARAMLQDGDTYLAGNDLIWNGHQAHPELRRLAVPRLDALRELPPDRLDAIIADLQRTRPKLVIDDYRMRMLPPTLKAYLLRRFAPLWSSVNGYAPLVLPEERQFDVWFDGRYLLDAPSGNAVIDGRSYASGALIQMERGPHRNDSRTSFRLQLQPPGLAAFQDPATRAHRAMFARPYDY